VIKRSGLPVRGIGDSLIFWIDEIIETSMGDVTEKTAQFFGAYTLHSTHRDFRNP
jgi:hypothetical protein